MACCACLSHVGQSSCRPPMASSADGSVGGSACCATNGPKTSNFGRSRKSIFRPFSGERELSQGPVFWCSSGANAGLSHTSSNERSCRSAPGFIAPPSARAALASKHAKTPDIKSANGPLIISSSIVKVSVVSHLLTQLAQGMVTAIHTWILHGLHWSANTVRATWRRSHTSARFEARPRQEIADLAGRVCDRNRR